MTARVVAALAALALASCGGAGRREVEEEPEPPDAGEAVAPLDRDPGPALAACRAAFERVDAAPAADRYALIAEGCADLFSLPLCAEAIRLSPQAAPELRPAMVAVACQHAYCPIFEAAGDPPRLCGLRPASMPPQELREPWGAFARVVLALELGLAADAPEVMSLAIDLAPALVGSAEALPLDAVGAGATPTLTVRVGREGSGYVVSADVDGEGFGPFPLTLEPNQEDFAGLLEAAARRAAGGGAVLHLDSSLAYRVAIELIDALRSLGISRVSLTVEAPASPPPTPVE